MALAGLNDFTSLQKNFISVIKFEWWKKLEVENLVGLSLSWCVLQFLGVMMAFYKNELSQMSIDGWCGWGSGREKNIPNN